MIYSEQQAQLRQGFPNLSNGISSSISRSMTLFMTFTPASMARH